MYRNLTYYSIRYSRITIIVAFLVTMFFSSMFPRIHIDTDPENMLEAEQPDRLFYQNVKKEFGIHDMLVLGIENREGIFSRDTLKRIEAIVAEILEIPGVIYDDVVSITTTNDVTLSDDMLVVHPVMETVPDDNNGIRTLREAIMSNHILSEKLISSDGKVAAIYVPIESKKDSYRVSGKIEEIVKRHLSDSESYYIAGLPIAEDTFGYAMFEQMGITAPLAGLVIFLILYILFRKISLIMAPMIVAMMSVLWTMGFLIGLGFTVHIMSSMIPVFLMPIAVLDGVHILSEFSDRYYRHKDRKKTLKVSMKELYTPMLYTSLTSAAGFFSLVFVPIPPVRVFGAFVAFGILVAWLLTITFIPAVIILIPESFFRKEASKKRKIYRIGNILKRLEVVTHRHYRGLLKGGLAVFLVGIVGITLIRINDNPVRWFKSGHPVRVSDTFMNKAFGGTYMAYLVVEGQEEGSMKRPEVLSYMDNLQRHLEKREIVGKTTSLSDIVKRVNYVLRGEEPDRLTIPDSADTVSQEIFLYLSSGDPDDLDNFVDYQYEKANIWIQMKKGDNYAMVEVEKDLEDFMSENPLPDGIKGFRWSGLTYINKIWQDLMVAGMLKAVLGGFLMVFILMVVMFRSIRLGIVSMIPLTFSIVFSYGVVGLIGKDYDMPIAVCSSLSLGLAVDFAIHFIERFRRKYYETGSLDEASHYIMGEPGRAITRNAIVITFGFLPLALSTLVPYITVGIFFSLLMISSAFSTLIILPALMKAWGRWLLGEPSSVAGRTIIEEEV